MTKAERDALQLKIENIVATIKALNAFQVSGENNLSVIFALIQFWKEELQALNTKASEENERVKKLLDEADGEGNKNDGSSKATGT